MKLQTSSWFAVVRAYQECTRRYSQMLAGFGLTIPQFDVMNAILALGEDATPKAIADELIVTRGNITGVLQRLQARMLIMTERHDQDGRSFVCQLTDEGRDVLARARQAAGIFIAQQLAPFDEETLLETERVMRQMRQHLMTIEPETIIDTVLEPDHERD